MFESSEWKANLHGKGVPTSTTKEPHSSLGTEEVPPISMMRLKNFRGSKRPSTQM